ncbi:MAG: hypothetical protein Kow0062_18770 [Acidobacteriota bacterium]|nr:MAG: hypothetical protein D6738_11480 [Acidobacteriota bacterium]
MRRVLTLIACLLPLLPPGALAAGRRPAGLPEDPRRVPNNLRLAVTESSADLDGDRVKEGIVLVEALTGEQEPARAVEVILGIVGGPGAPDNGTLLWTRHVSRDTGQPAHSAEITAVDLDGDGGSELILTWDRALDDRTRDRFAEIWAVDGPGRLRKVWQGRWEVDTRRTDSVPVAERTRYQTRIDFGATRRLAGRGIVFERVYTVVAGETLAEPKIVREQVAVRLRP